MKRAIAIALLATSGCSLFMTDPPPVLTPMAEPDCSDSRAAPIVDLIGAGTTAYLGLLIYALAHVIADNDGVQDNTRGADTAAAVIGIGATTAYVASAVTGFHTASRCRAAKSTWYLTMAPNAPNPIRPMPAAMGTERAWCRPPPGAPCDPGLTCASGHCVLVPPPQPQ